METKFYTMTPNICACSLWNQLHVNLPISRNLRWLLDILQICAPFTQESRLIRRRGDRRVVLFSWRNMAFSQPIQCVLVCGLVTWLQDAGMLTIRFHSELTCLFRTGSTSPVRMSENDYCHCLVSYHQQTQVRTYNMIF